MNLLAIDTATNACSAALWLGGQPGPARRAVMRRGHGEALMPMVVEVMEEADIAFTDLQGLAVTTGPGAFTGIRIGLAAARGFALAAGLPLVGVTTLEAVAAAQESGGHQLLVALDSKRADVYAQIFAADGTPCGRPVSIMPEEIGGVLPVGETIAVAGDMAERVLEALAGRRPPPLRLAGPALPDASVVVRIAARIFAESPPAPDAPPPSALYLHPPDAIPLALRSASAKEVQ